MSERKAELLLLTAIALKHAGLLDAELDAVEMVKQAEILLEKLEEVEIDLTLRKGQHA